MKKLWLLATAALLALPLAAMGEELSPDRSYDDPFGKEPTLKAQSASVVKTKTLAWVEAQGVEDAKKEAARKLWEGEIDKLAPDALLDRFAEAAAFGDPRIEELLKTTAQVPTKGHLPQFAVLADESLDGFIRANLQLYHGRWLSRHRYYDEALVALAAVKPEEVLDPASLLFFQSVAAHKLVMPKEGLATISRLLDDVADAPVRYRSVASLMQQDLAAVEPESLDHISRHMGDIQRRLDLARAGKKVQKQEDDVIAMLDKMIKKLEDEECKACQGGGGGGGKAGGNRSAGPANQSNAAGGGGPGQITKKNINKATEWGNLPEKERQASLQGVPRDFPSHYRDIIEQYFRRLAEDEK
jgi:hypothetical protein